MASCISFFSYSYTMTKVANPDEPPRGHKIPTNKTKSLPQSRNGRSHRDACPHGQPLLPIRPPSPWLSGVDEKDISTEKFPDFLDMSDCLGDHGEEQHCMIHCKKSVCKGVVERAKCSASPPFLCSCPPTTPNSSSPLSEKKHASNPEAPIYLTHEMFHKLHQEKNKWDTYNQPLTITEARCMNTVDAIEDFLLKRSTRLWQLQESLTRWKRFPTHIARQATISALRIFSHACREYFERSFALSSLPELRIRKVLLADLIGELENYLLTYLGEWMGEYVWRKKICLPPRSVRGLLEERTGDVVNVVWAFWTEAMDDLGRMVVWTSVDRSGAGKDKKRYEDLIGV